MSIFYYPGKADVVVDALSRLSIGSTVHDDERIMELEKDVLILACLGTRPMDSTEEEEW